MSEVRARMIESFFDRDSVLRAADRATLKNLSRCGAFVRTRARSSIRRRKAISRPGEVPSSHTGAFRKNIFFGYDASRKSVVIGPVKLRGDSRVSESLEHGGPSRVMIGPRDRRREVTATIAARPTMGPALVAEAPNFPGLWADTLR